MIKQCPSFHNNLNLLKCLIKRYVFKDFLNTGNVPDPRMFAGKLFHSRGDAAPHAESPMHFFVMPWCNVVA